MFWIQKHGPLGMGEFGLAVHRFLYNYLSQDIKICFPASWTTLTIQQYFCVEELLMCWTKSTTMGDQWKSESNRLLVLSFPGSMQRMALSLYHFHRYFFWPDVLDGLKEMFTRTQFVCDQGGYFPEIKVDFISWTSTCHVTPFSNQAHPERFIMKRRPEFRDWLKMLRQNGKFLYVITGERHKDVSPNDTTINLRQSCWLCLPCCVVRPGRRLVSKHSVCLRCLLSL